MLYVLVCRVGKVQLLELEKFWQPLAAAGKSRKSPTYRLHFLPFRDDFKREIAWTGTPHHAKES
jgi:hypothetical protein